MKSNDCGEVSTHPASATNRTEPKLLDRVREAVRLRHYSRRTEEAYVVWIRRFIVFHGKKHPSLLGKDEIVRDLTWLAVQQHASASTQNQALSALLFLRGTDSPGADAPRPNTACSRRRPVTS